MRWAVAVLLAACAATSMVVLAAGLGFLLAPVGIGEADTPDAEQIVRVEPGSGFAALAHQLSETGLVRKPQALRALARLSGKDAQVRVGEFALRPEWRPARLLHELVAGREILHKLAVPEGLTWWQVADLVQASGLATVADFAAAVQDPELLAAYHIPATTAEGYLFPETYALPRPAELNGAAARAVATAMLDQFFRVAGQVWPDTPPAPEELYRLVTLASVVEKETGAPEERFRVAGVYANRLAKNMLLQADPTVIYGLGQSFDGNLRRSDLEDKANPYNTYRHRGLPPGPICSPGRAALEAAAAPEEHKYLYFVSRRDGSHQFSSTLSEHNDAVRRFQLRRQ